MDYVASWTDAVNVRAVFVGHPECSVVVHHKSFTVDGHPLAARTCTPKAITRVCCLRQIRESRDKFMARAIRVKTSRWDAGRISEENRVQVLEVDIRWGGISHRGAVVGRQSDDILMNPVLIIDGACA